MTQINKQRPRRSASTATPRPPRRMSPSQAARCCRPIDTAMDPALFRAMSDPTRAAIVACLAKCCRPCAVGEVAACCSVDMSVVSRHLSLLETAGVLESKKLGRTVLYSVRYAQLCQTLRSIADALEACCPAGCCSTPKGGCCD